MSLRIDVFDKKEIKSSHPIYDAIDSDNLDVLKSYCVEWVPSDDVMYQKENLNPIQYALAHNKLKCLGVMVMNVRFLCQKDQDACLHFFMHQFNYPLKITKYLILKGADIHAIPDGKEMSTIALAMALPKEDFTHVMLCVVDSILGKFFTESGFVYDLRAKNINIKINRLLDALSSPSFSSEQFSAVRRYIMYELEERLQRFGNQLSDDEKSDIRQSLSTCRGEKVKQEEVEQMQQRAKPEEVKQAEQTAQYYTPVQTIYTNKASMNTTNATRRSDYPHAGVMFQQPSQSSGIMLEPVYSREYFSNSSHVKRK